MPGLAQRLKGLGRWPTLIFWALFTRALARCLLIGTATARQGKPDENPIRHSGVFFAEPGRRYSPTCAKIAARSLSK
jgi:hypothetical protein